MSTTAKNHDSNAVKAGIVGASGYSGEELIRLLARHPHVDLACVTSRTLMGKSVTDIIPKMASLLPDSLKFSESNPKQLAQSDLDIVFLALPHGVAAEYAIPITQAGKKVIDLSADFRLNSDATYQEFYNQPHPDPQLLEKAAYVIPEITAEGWKEAPLIASPGCYPTSAIIPLFPLLAAGICSDQNIVINSASGVSGAGKKVAEDFIFCERSESAKAYGLPKHRHLSEIEEQLSIAAQKKIIVQFNPHLSPMKRGIVTTITVPAAKNATIETLYQTWEAKYSNQHFVNILPSGKFPDTAHTVGTNRIDISAVYDPRTQNFILTSAEDNLLKGASGQAVQIMNLWFGFNETDGLL